MSLSLIYTENACIHLQIIDDSYIYEEVDMFVCQYLVHRREVCSGQNPAEETKKVVGP